LLIAPEQQRVGVQQKSHWEASVVLLPEIVSQGLQQFLRIDQELRLICDPFAPVLGSRPDQSGNFLLVALNHNGFTGCNLIQVLKEVLAEVRDRDSEHSSFCTK
jgi:hypothetical protein